MDMRKCFDSYQQVKPGKLPDAFLPLSAAGAKSFFIGTSFIACSQVVAIYVSWNTRDKDEVVR